MCKAAHDLSRQKSCISMGCSLQFAMHDNAPSSCKWMTNPPALAAMPKQSKRSADVPGISHVLKGVAMGSANRIQGPVYVDGQQSVVLSRPAPAAPTQTWTILQRPYQAADPQELLRDASSDTLTCLLAGNRIRMGDRSLKRIESIQVGDEVMTMSGAKRIERTETTTLGLTRCVIELRGLGDQVLFLSSDHPLWISRPSAAGGTKEWWGTYNIHHTLVEMAHGIGLEFRELPFILRYDLPEQVAHESGWLHVRPIFHDLPASTELHHLVVEDGFSFIAEGFPVLSHCRDYQGPATPWRGLDNGAARAGAVERLVAAGA